MIVELQRAESWWNGTDERNTEFLGKKLVQLHFVHKESHTELPAAEAGPLQSVAKHLSRAAPRQLS